MKSNIFIEIILKFFSLIFRQLHFFSKFFYDFICMLIEKVHIFVEDKTTKDIHTIS